MRKSLLVMLIVTSCAACGGSPTRPSPGSSAPIHDTLNATGNFGANDFVWSERSGGEDRQVYDDFVSATSAAIRTIAWQGIRPTMRPPASFHISFIADDGGFILRRPDNTNSGRPGALYGATFPVAQVNEQLGVTRACDNSPQQQCGSYDYTVTLAAPFRTTAGTRYWILIQAESPLGSLSGWSWRKGQTANSFSMSNLANTLFTWDFAFALRP